MKRRTFLLLAVAALLLALPAPALNAGRTWYVSQITGSDQNDGSRERPLMHIQRAVELASSGDVIRVAEGNYYGLQNSGNIKIDKGVSIFGGYAADFSKRDILTHRTFIQPSASSNTTAMGQGTVQINVRQSGTLVELDGLILDRGNSVAYSPRDEGRPEGVETGMMQPTGTAGIGAPGVPEEKVYTSESALVYINTGSRCDVTIRNCAFLNGPNYGLLGSTYSTKILIDNCIFVNIRMAAVELRGASSVTNSETRFTRNTVLFIWSRLKDLSDMGYGYRYMPKMDSRLDHNIFGCCILAGLDRTPVDSPAEKEAERVTTCENSLFFQNRRTDLTLPGGGMPLCVSVRDFGDVEQLDDSDDNKAVDDPSIFGGALNEAYLHGFLDVSATRMFANHYPVADALKLFGAVPGYGAQLPVNQD